MMFDVCLALVRGVDIPVRVGGARGDVEQVSTSRDFVYDLEKVSVMELID